MPVAEHGLEGGWRISDAVDEIVPDFAALENFHLDAEEIDGHVDGDGMRETHGVLLGSFARTFWEKVTASIRTLMCVFLLALIESHRKNPETAAVGHRSIQTTNEFHEID